MKKFLFIVLAVLVLVAIILMMVCRKKEKSVPEIVEPPVVSPIPTAPPVPTVGVTVPPRGLPKPRPPIRAAVRGLIGGPCDYFASPTGLASNSGATGSRWSIDRAFVNSAGTPEPGSVVCFAAGDYTRTALQGAVIANVSGTSIARITFQPENLGDRVTIRSADATAGIAPILQLYGSYYDVLDFELTSVDGCNRVGADAWGAGTSCSGGMTIYGDNIRSWRNVVHDTALVGFYDGNQPVSSGGNC